MIKKIANQLSRKYVTTGVLNEDDMEICTYGLEIAISTITSISLVLILSLIFGNLAEGIGYLLFYCSLRTYAGGYHAKTHTSCILTFILLYSIVLCLSKVGIFSNDFFVLPMLLFCDVVVVFLKTVDAINNPFSVSSIKNMHKIAIILMACHNIIILIMNKVPILTNIGTFALLGDFVCCLLMIVGFIEKKQNLKGE